MFWFFIYGFGFVTGWFFQKYKTRLFRLGAKLEQKLDAKLDAIEKS